MSYNINLVETWGKPVGLDLAISSWSTIVTQVPVLKTLADKYDLYSNDGRVLPFWELNDEDTRDALLDQITGLQVEDWVAKWVVKLLKIARENSEGSYGVAFH